MRAACIGPSAVLNDRMGKRVGKYDGPPATWEAMGGSKLAGVDALHPDDQGPEGRREYPGRLHFRKAAQSVPVRGRGLGAKRWWLDYHPGFSSS